VGNTSSTRDVNSCRKAATTEALARDVNSNENISTNRIDSGTRDNWNIMGRQQQHGRQPCGNSSSRKDVGSVGAPATGGMSATAETTKTVGNQATPTAAIASTAAQSTARAEATGTSQTQARDAI
jgi:hypothetical protein